MSKYDRAIEENENEMRYLLKRIEEAVKNARTLIEAQDWNSFDAGYWMKGHAAKEVTHLSSLFSMRLILEQAKEIEDREETAHHHNASEIPNDAE